jgi:hypothetical protein
VNLKLGFRVGEIGKPLEFGRDLCEGAELTRGERVPKRGHVRVSSLRRGSASWPSPPVFLKHDSHRFIMFKQEADKSVGMCPEAQLVNYSLSWSETLVCHG